VDEQGQSADPVDGRGDQSLWRNGTTPTWARAAYWAGVILPVCIVFIDGRLGEPCGPSVVPYWVLGVPVAMLAVAVMASRGPVTRRVVRLVAGIALSVALVILGAVIDIFFVSGWHQC
jgi:hypothetical protein